MSSCLPSSIQEKFTERKSAILTIQKITYQQRIAQKENRMTYAVLHGMYICEKIRHSSIKYYLNIFVFLYSELLRNTI